MASEISKGLSKIAKLSGISDGQLTAVLSDTVDLITPGFMQPRLSAGTIKYTDVRGNICISNYDLKEVSLVRVSRIWSTGTTVDMGIVIYY